ncbi:endonuclease MutS2 [Staphylospora marina]|uniref:endonuclease MutS2 n=1 Tax=Staphylospora marina TaxID=2490858 RepID=UPI000F5BBBED|nr:endonuclease MutS2 [Staphylospora marina]
MEQWTLNTLEYHQVVELVKHRASSEPGREWLDGLVPSDDPEEVKRRLQAVAEGMDVLRLKGEVPLSGIRDIRTALKRAELGGMLDEADCLDVASTVSAGRKVKSLMKRIAEEQASLPLLRDLVGGIESLDKLEQALTEAIDENGTVRDQASPELHAIRRQLDRVRRDIQETLQRMIRDPRIVKMLQEPIITQRQDRYCLPVKQEYRASFGGIVHDQSSSGATLFIEPQSVVLLNNRLRELELAERKEVEKVLARLTSLVSDETEPLRENLRRLAELDAVMAKARFGSDFNGVCPDVSDRMELRLKKARHPLIPRDRVVPIDVEMGTRWRAIIITGPNTGGKTVTLKTIGLFALMTQSGIPIPADEGSMLPVYSGVLADIGDEQSIEQNLSTFSGHMKNIIRIIERLDERSLVMFDELGAGTDPTEGAALAIAILEHAIARGSSVVATTHYSELKEFAHTHPQAVNASVEFDEETLRPTYRLLVGVPGRSNAFAIASRLGLSTDIINAAKSRISADEQRLEEMIASLGEERRLAEEERRNMEQLRREAERWHEELEKKRLSWEEEKEKMREKARQEARAIVQKARREAEEVLKELREWARQKPQDLKEHQLTEAKKRLEEAIPSWEKNRANARATAADTNISVGDEVRVLTVNQKGTVVEALPGDEFQVQIGVLKMKVHRDRLEKLKQPKKRTEPKGSTSIHRTGPSVRPELDLRGMMVDEAIPEIDRYLDQAILSGYKQVHLIHGKGTGALRAGVQEFLRRHRAVKSYRLGAHGEGGSGVTVVELR